MGGLSDGERVLIHSAGGGVGISATQIAKMRGAEVFGTASASKHDAIREQGVDHAIDYRTQDFAEEVMRLTGGEGVDVIFDALGPTSARKGYRILRQGGRLIIYGASEVSTGETRNLFVAAKAAIKTPLATMPWWKSLGMINENKGVFGLNMLHWWDKEGSLDRVIEPLIPQLQKGELNPVVAESLLLRPCARRAPLHRRAPQRRQGRPRPLTASWRRPACSNLAPMKQGISLIAVLLAALPAGSAFGSAAEPGVSVAISGGGAQARASALQLGVNGSAEAEEISVTLDGTQTQYVITSTRPINPPPPPCVQISTFQITCPTSDFVAFDASLGAGNDNFTVGPSVDVPVTMSGGSGLDFLRGGSGTDTMNGGLGADRLLGNNGADTLRGGKSGDVLKGGKGRDLLNGGKGGDSLQGGPGRDIEKQ